MSTTTWKEKTTRVGSKADDQTAEKAVNGDTPDTPVGAVGVEKLESGDEMLGLSDDEDIKALFPNAFFC